MFSIASRTALCGLVLLTLWLAGRRAAGGLSRPLEILELCGLTVVMLFCVAPFGLRDLGRLAPILSAVVTVAVWLLLYVTEAPVVVWMIALSADAVWWARHRNGRIARSSPPAEVEDAVEEAVKEVGLAEDVLQQWTRARTEDGDVLSGLTRVEFQPGEQTAVVHVPFHPPFARPPEISASILEGEASEPKATLVQTFGVRLEIRRANSRDAETMILEFTATEASKLTNS